MTCAQGLLRLLWGGPEVGVLRDWFTVKEVISSNGFCQHSGRKDVLIALTKQRAGLLQSDT